MADPLKQLEQVLQSVPPQTPENLEVREEMLLNARKLMLALERPDNTMERLCFGIWELILVQVAIDMGIFRQLDKKSPSKSDEIAAATKSEPSFLSRVLRGLVSFDVIDQNTAEEFSANSITKTLVNPRHEASIECIVRILLKGWIAMPDFLKETNYQNPTSGSKTAFAKGYGKVDGATLWEILKDHPNNDSLNTFMSAYHTSHKTWMDVYPVTERLINGARTGAEDVLLIDVGGGLGHQGVRFRERFPNAPGRVVVQDLAQGLAKEKPEGVELIAHDFFTEQPIKGARTYYFRWVLHDWGQDRCAAILTKIREAMEPGYSRLLIHEWVLPDIAPTKYMTTQDFNMMSVGGGMERTEGMHREYLEKAGLKVTEIYRPGDKFSECVIEADIA